jgi:class 3 adenylate cyclase
MTGPLVSLLLPEHPRLRTWSSVLNDNGYWAYVLDTDWRVVFVTDEFRLAYGDSGETTCVPVGQHFYGAAMVEFHRSTAGGGMNNEAAWRERFREFGQYVLAAAPGGREGVRRAVAPEFSDLVDELEPVELPTVMSVSNVSMSYASTQVGLRHVYVRIDENDGRLAGVAIIPKPAAGMSQLVALAATADLDHLERMRLFAQPDRRPAAILMADVEASSPLARRLSTAHYFAFGRRLVRMADQCIIEHGGIVGRHAGDGIVAFFLAETAGSESAAARACITAAHKLRASIGHVAERSELAASEISLRFGLHWGSTLYMGRILTGGRSEVTALGEEVNEAARIEACATGGRTLASKSLIERLDRVDANDLEIDTGRTTYTPLGNLSTATDKARRDAPSIAVCDITDLVA